MPAEVVARLRAVCSALPEATESSGAVGVDFRIRRRSFAHVFSVTDDEGRQSCLLALRADPDEREALLATGHPYFPVGGGADRVGVALEDGTDWREIAELVTTSYCVRAPRKLAALVDAPPDVDLRG